LFAFQLDILAHRRYRRSLFSPRLHQLRPLLDLLLVNHLDEVLSSLPGFLESTSTIVQLSLVEDKDINHLSSTLPCSRINGSTRILHSFPSIRLTIIPRFPIIPTTLTPDFLPAIMALERILRCILVPSLLPIHSTSLPTRLSTRPVSTLSLDGLSMTQNFQCKSLQPSRIPFIGEDHPIVVEELRTILDLRRIIALTLSPVHLHIDRMLP